MGETPTLENSWTLPTSNRWRGTWRVLLSWLLSPLHHCGTKAIQIAGHCRNFSVDVSEQIAYSGWCVQIVNLIEHINHVFIFISHEVVRDFAFCIGCVGGQVYSSIYLWRSTVLNSERKCVAGGAAGVTFEISWMNVLRFQISHIEEYKVPAWHSCYSKYGAFTWYFVVIMKDNSSFTCSEFKNAWVTNTRYTSAQSYGNITAAVNDVAICYFVHHFVNYIAYMRCEIGEKHCFQ